MRLNKLTNWLGSGQTGETLAVFGEAHLVKHLNGKLELRGGTHADHIAAREWCSLFLHNAVITSPRRGAFSQTPDASHRIPVFTPQ